MIDIIILACCLKALQDEHALDSDHVAIQGMLEVDRANVLLGGRKKSVGVPFAVDVETDKLAVVVDAVDSGTIITDTAESLPVVDALGVVDCLPLHVKQRTGQQETTRLVIAVHIGTNDLVILVDTQEHRAGRRRPG